ncbi:hypothetical protein V1283_003723 [Bradyrhizobium sp. AZCC 2262]
MEPTKRETMLACITCITVHSMDRASVSITGKLGALKII